MISVSKAASIISENVPTLGTVQANLLDAVGCVLAEDIKADSDMPPFDRSQMDGFAVRAAETQVAPVLLDIAGESAAGKGYGKTLKKGEAVRIMTGAPVPKGADAVQKIELTIEVAETQNLGGDTVTILEPVKKGQFIVPRGFEIKKNAVVFKKGTAVTPEMVAGLAAFGRERINVGAAPKVAVLATGSEIVEVGKMPGKDQIRNSNSPMLAALIEQFGGDAKILPAAPDDTAGLEKAISAAAKKADIVIITGGVSVGKYDLTKSSLADLGAEIYFEKLRLKPGKPMVFATLGKTLIFGLPGNPVSVAVTFHLFVRSAMLQMQGCTEPEMAAGFAVISKPMKGTKGRDSYLPARLRSDKAGLLIADPVKWHGSSDFIGFAGADVLAVVPREKTLEKGEVARILYL